MSQDTHALTDLCTDPEEAQIPVPDPDDHFDVLFSDDEPELDEAEPEESELDVPAAAGQVDAVPSMAPGPLAGTAFAPQSFMAVALAPAGIATLPDGDAFPGAKAFRLGKSHPAVTRLGKMLVARGAGRFYAEGPGPVFGVADRNACAAFQRAQGWTGNSADGYPGPLTWELLVEKKGKSVSKASATLLSPVPGYRANYPFGVKNRRYSAGFHTGVDYAAPNGTPIVAVVGGTVIRTDNGGAYGNWTQIRGNDGHVWMYAHQSRRAVKHGQQVRTGQVIGYVGSSGKVTGPHLHLEKSKGSSWSYASVVEPRW